MNLRDWLTYISYSMMWRLVRMLPEKSAYRLFNIVARRSYRQNGKRVQRLRRNYQQVSPDSTSAEIERMVKDGLSSAMRYWCDTFRISDWSGQRIVSTVRLENEAIFYQGIKSGKGLIVALPHAGNWDHAGLFFCSQGVQVNTVAEHLKPERLFQRFLRHREKMGMRVLDLDADVLNDLEKILRSGSLVALVADRDLSKSGIEVDFFGAKARMPAGPALLSYRTGADLIVAYVGYRTSGIDIRFSGPIPIERKRAERDEVRSVTQEMARIFEGDIKKDPVSWHMQQRVFVEEISQPNFADDGSDSK